MSLLIKKLTAKEIILHIITIILLVLFEAYVLIFMLNPLMTRHFKTAGFRYATYDVILRGATHSYVNSLKEMDNVKNVIELIPGGFYTKDIGYSLNITCLVGSSLEELYDIIIPKNLFTEIDENLMKKDNAVIIHIGDADYFNISCGDVISVGYLINGNVEMRDLQVAGLFESSVFNDSTVSINAIALNIDKTANEFMNNYVYVDFYDSNKGNQYIEDNYFDQRYAFEKYGDQWEEKITEKEKLESKNNSYDIRTVSLKRAEEELKHNRIETYVHVSIGLFFIIVVQVYNNHKSIKLNLKKLAVLRVCGLNMYKIFAYMFLSSFVTQLIVLVLITFVSGYSSFIIKHIPKMLLVQGIPVIIICSLLASLLIGIIAILELRQQKISYILRSED